MHTVELPPICTPSCSLSLTQLGLAAITAGLKRLSMEASLKASRADFYKEELCLWVEEHGDYLFSYALRHFSSPAEAEDLVQETFLGALQSISNFKNQSSVRTWLTGILRHKIFDRIRKNKSEKRRTFETSVDNSTLAQFDTQEHWTEVSSPSQWNLTPAEAYERNDLYAKVKECLEKLPEKFRSVFLMRELDGLSREEIGESNGVSGNNIGVILHRARSSLRECLEKNWLR